MKHENLVNQTSLICLITKMTFRASARWLVMLLTLREGRLFHVGALVALLV